MTHSTEELRLQYEAAKSRAVQADKDRREALDRYHAALCSDKLAEFEAMGGVIGKTRVRVAEYGRKDVPDMKYGPHVVIGCHVKYEWHTDARYRLAKIKKDGTPSAAPSGADCATVFILPEDQI